jgi:hypothetical protein
MQRKTLFKNDWVSTVLLNGWYIATEESRCPGNNLVAVLPWRLKSGERQYLARFEENLAHGGEDNYPTSIITGGCETKDILHHAQDELLEEGGYNIERHRFIPLGTCHPLKSSFAVMNLFTVRIINTDKRVRAEGDGTLGEKGAWCSWVGHGTLIWAKDPYIHTILVRMK